MADAVGPVPPAFEQVRLYTYVPAVVMGPTVADPGVVLFEPLQLPPAVQLVGEFVALQLTVAVALAPAVSVVGLTLIVTFGTATTVSVAVALPEPALFEQVIV